MRVALELQPCCGKRSGIGLYTYELAKRLRDRDGLEFCGNLFNFMGRNDNQKALSGITFPIRESRSFPYGVYRRIWNVFPIPYQSMFPRADLNIFFNYIVPPRIKGRVITTFHDMTYLRFPETMDSKNLRRLRAGIPYSIARSDRIITVSLFSKKEISELLNIPEERIAVVYNAPSLSQGTANFEDVVRKYQIRRPFLLYVGTIEPRKNLARLLHVFLRLKQKKAIPHQLVLAGGKGWANDEIYHSAEKLCATGDAVFTGYVTGEEKNSLYREASAFVFPSVYEGFGIPPLEAMTLGCPVICSHAASLPEVVGDAAELVDPLSEESIEAGLYRVLSNQEYAETLRQKGYARAKKFSWETSAERLTTVCREVLERM